MKSNKTAKTPKAFRKPIPAKAFDKKFARMLEQDKDVAFFRSCFEERDGKFVAKGDLDEKSAKRLKSLGKAIKANRGVFKAGPTIALALVGGGAVVFGLFFMNPTLEKAAESGLAAAFGAQADIDGLRFSPLGMRISVAGLAIADRDEPMTNLVETGRLELRLNAAAALRGKVYIEEAAAESIAAGTARAESGALPGSPARPGSEKPAKVAAPPMVDLKAFDAAALLEREKAKLASTAAYESAGAAYDEASARWKARAASSGAAVDGLEASTRSVLAIDVKKLTTPDAVAKALADAKAAAESVKTAVAEADAVQKGVKADMDSLAKLEKAAESALADDIGYLKSLVDPSSGAAMAALEPSVREILSDKAERYLYYAGRALEILSAVRADDADAEPKDEPKSAYGRGRDVRFPSTTYPAFRLGLLKSEFRAGDADWAVALREVSTEPALVAEPSAFSLSMKKGGSSAGADAVVDLREAGKASWTAELSGAGLALDLGDALKDAGLGAFSADLAGSGAADGAANGDESGRLALDLELTLTKARVGSPSGTFGTALAGAIAGVDAIEADIAYEKAPDGNDAFRLRTNLDDVVADAVKAMAGRYAKEAMADVEAAVRDYAGDELEGKLASKEELDDVFAAVKGDKAAADGVKAKLDQKVKALEDRARTLGADALKGIAPSLPPIRKP